mmetsp:Transcript_124663/g.360659  ORF Transcript_124663/g.360659 Transcript_124663/m.360659 type:complete len:235 (-) Transcript_124663:246-950(-)
MVVHKLEECHFHCQAPCVPRLHHMLFARCQPFGQLIVPTFEHADDPHVQDQGRVLKDHVFGHPLNDIAHIQQRVDNEARQSKEHAHRGDREPVPQEKRNVAQLLDRLPGGCPISFRGRGQRLQQLLLEVRARGTDPVTSHRHAADPMLDEERGPREKQKGPDAKDCRARPAGSILACMQEVQQLHNNPESSRSDEPHRILPHEHKVVHGIGPEILDELLDRRCLKGIPRAPHLS